MRQRKGTDGAWEIIAMRLKKLLTDYFHKGPFLSIRTSAPVLISVLIRAPSWWSWGDGVFEFLAPVSEGAAIVSVAPYGRRPWVSRNWKMGSILSINFAQSI
jgi:hypothetical protein